VILNVICIHDDVVLNVSLSYDIKLVIQRFGNLKVGSVFGFLHPKTAVWVLKTKNCFENLNCGFGFRNRNRGYLLFY